MAEDSTAIEKPLTMQWDYTVALQIITHVHGEQKDKAGLPYAMHLFRVAEQMDMDAERIVALLHDSLEDSGRVSRLSISIMMEQAYGKIISDAVWTLTRHGEKGREPYEDYIERVSENRLATKVKLKDLADNVNPQRLRKLPRADSERLYDRYTKAIQFLMTKQMQWEDEDYELRHQAR